jgi:hypothetical protein
MKLESLDQGTEPVKHKERKDQPIEDGKGQDDLRSHGKDVVVLVSLVDLIDLLLERTRYHVAVARQLNYNLILELFLNQLVIVANLNTISLQCSQEIGYRTLLINGAIGRVGIIYHINVAHVGLVAGLECVLNGVHSRTHPNNHRASDMLSRLAILLFDTNRWTCSHFYLFL